MLREDAGLEDATTLESDAFRTTETTVEELSAEAATIRRRFALGGPLLGGFVMLVADPEHPRHLPPAAGGRSTSRDRGECVSCGRCFSHCPREHLRRKERGP